MSRPIPRCGRAPMPASWAAGCDVKRGCERRSVRTEPSGVAGERRQHRWIDADLAKRCSVFAFEVAAEQQFLIGGAMQPAIALYFVIELAGPPAGIAEREQHPARPGSLSNGTQDVERRG